MITDQWSNIPDGEYVIHALGQERTVTVWREVHVDIDVNGHTRRLPDDLALHAAGKILAAQHTL